MRKFILLGLLVLPTTMLSSQRSYVGLSFGASLPGEEFSKTSLQENGGYALPGFALEFSGAYIFDYYFGIAGTFTFGSNALDRDKYLEDLVESLPDPVPPDAEVIFNNGTWMYSNIMAGPFLTLPVWKLNFDLRAVAGLSVFMTPPQELTVNTQTETYFQQRSAQTANFAYMIGTGIRFHINEAYSVRLSADYFHSKPSIKISSTNIAGQPNEDSAYDMNVGTLNIGVGIAYRF